MGNPEGPAWSSDPSRTIATVLLALVVAGLFAWNVSLTTFIGDDAFISFRYADHLVRGEGLVWNVGERVEGYTNFLWVLLMALSLAFGVPPEISSNALGIASGAALLLAVGVFSARRSGADLGVWLLLLTLAASRSFATWCTSGLETMFFSLLVFLAYARFVAERERGAERALGSAALFALAALTRPEGLLFAAVAGAALLVDVLRGARPLRTGLAWAIPLAAIVGAHFGFRLVYYGEWLPNTFYAKVAGLWLAQSVHYLDLFNREYQVVWFLPLLLPAVWGGRARTARLFLSVLVAYLLYLLYVGGDRFEFRFLVVVYPYLYWLIVEGLRRVVDLTPRIGPALAAAIGVALLVVTASAPRREVPPTQRFGVVPTRSVAIYTMGRIRQGRFLRDLIDRGELPADLVTAMGGVGAVPYYTRWKTIDTLGLNDARIARMPVEERGMIGHEHRAPHEYLVARKVAVYDIFNNLVHGNLLALRNPRRQFYDGHRTRLRAVAVDGRFLIFATYVSDEELAEIFEGHEILSEPPAPESAAAPRRCDRPRDTC